MHGRAYKQYIFLSYNTSAFSAIRSDENPFRCQCGKEKNKAYGFNILHLYWSFLCEIMAVKGLRYCLCSRMKCYRITHEEYVPASLSNSCSLFVVVSSQNFNFGMMYNVTLLHAASWF